MGISSVYILCCLKSSSPAKAISETKLDTFKIPLEKSSHVSLKVIEAVSQLIRDFS